MSPLPKVLAEDLEAAGLCASLFHGHVFDDRLSALTITVTLDVFLAQDFFVVKSLNGRICRRTDGAQLGGLHELARFGHSQSEIQDSEGWYQSQSDLQAPNSVKLSELLALQGCAEDTE